MLKFLKYTGITIGFTPNEINEIKSIYPLLEGTKSPTYKGSHLSVKLISSTQIIITFNDRIINKTLRITKSKLEELLSKEEEFLPYSLDERNFAIEFKNDDADHIRISNSKRVERWLRIQCSYLILEDCFEMYKCLYHLILPYTNTETLNNLKTLITLEKAATFSATFSNPNNPNHNVKMQLNVTKTNSAKAGTRYSSREVLFFQIVKGNKVVFGFSEPYLQKVIDILKVVI